MAAQRDADAAWRRAAAAGVPGGGPGERSRATTRRTSAEVRAHAPCGWSDGWGGDTPQRVGGVRLAVRGHSVVIRNHGADFERRWAVTDARSTRATRKVSRSASGRMSRSRGTCASEADEAV